MQLQMLREIPTEVQNILIGVFKNEILETIFIRDEGHGDEKGRCAA